MTHRCSRALTRFTAAALLPFVVHLSMLGSGVRLGLRPACVGPAAVATTTTMAVSAPAALAMPESHGTDARDPAIMGEAGNGHGDECDRPWAAGCPSSAACGAVTLMLPPTGIADAGAADSPRYVVDLGIRKSPTVSPDIPPPRIQV